MFSAEQNVDAAYTRFVPSADASPPRALVWQIGFLGPAFFLTQLSHVTTPVAAVACMMASQGLDAFSQSGLYSNHQASFPMASSLLPYSVSVPGWFHDWLTPGQSKCKSLM
jgi:hypothetical protein